MANESQLEAQLRELEGLKSSGVITEEEYQARREALLAVPAAPGERRSGCLGIFKWGFFGCLGAIAAVAVVFVVIAIIIAAAAGGDDDDGGDVHVTLAPGASGEIAPQGNGQRRSQVTILEIADPADSGNAFLVPDVGNRFWAALIEVENVGTRQVTSLDWTLRADGFEYDWTIGGDIDVLLYSDLTPGSKRQGWVFFEIPQDAAVDWLRADPNPFLANDLYFDAE